MKRVDDMKKFFEKRLLDDTPATDEWNVPSDDIWNKAIVHFPKEKKRDRGVLFFLFGTGTAVLLTIGYLWLSDAAIEQNEDKELIAADVEYVDESKIDAKNESLTVDTKIGLDSEKDRSSDNDEAVSIMNKKAINKKAIDEGSLQLSNTVPSAEFVIQSPEENFSADDNAVVDYMTNLTTRKNGSGVAGEIEKAIVGEIVQPIVDESIPTKSLATKESDLQEFSRLNGFDLLPARFTAVEVKERVVSEALEYSDLKQWKKFRAWELGLTHAPFFINPDKWLVDESEDADFKQTISLKYRNANFVASRMLGKRWSITSGIGWVDLGLTVDFEGDDRYVDMTSEDQFRNFFNDNGSVGSIELDGNSQDLIIEFLPNVSLINGDDIHIKAKIPMNLRLIQVPFLLNYHIPLGRFELQLHSGFAVDFGKITIDELEFAIYKEQQLITAPLEFAPLSENLVGLSFYAGGGLKYHVTDRFNLGINTRIDLLELPLSRYELGGFYKF